MSPNEIEARLRTGEDSRTEFKSAQVDVDALEKALCAFANSGGGEILVGVGDDGAVQGAGSLDSVDKLQRRITQLFNDSILPPLRGRLIVVEVRALLVLVVRVPGFLPERPFRTKSGRYFVRDGPMSREARPDELKRILLSGPSYYFDEEPVVDATRDDLDELAIQDFFSAAYPGWSTGQTTRYLRALLAVSREDTPTVTGILLFGRDPQAYLLDAYVTLIRFPGDEVRSQFTAREEVRGRLTDQLDAAIAFLVAQHPSGSRVEGVARQETGVPVEVWREAVANALAHRDYQASAQTRIFVFNDRVEFANPGVLLNQLTIDGLRLGITQRRNPHIAAALARRQLRENAGVGIPDMIQTLVARGLPEPELRVENGEFRLTVFTQPREP